MKIKIVKRKQVGIGILALALAVPLLVTACAPSTIPATGEKVVKIGNIGMLTGGGATSDQPSFQAFQDYVRYFNEEKGIPGVTVELAWADCETQVTQFISSYRVLVAERVPVIFTDYPIPLEGLKPQLEKDQMPVVTAIPTGPLVYPPGWIYAAWPTEGEAATVLLDYFMQNWKEQGPPKLQLFVEDLSYGREAAQDITKYAESRGFEVLPLEVAPLVAIDVTTQLLRIQERQPDLVYIVHVLSGAGPIMRDVERLGLQTKMQFAGNQWIVGDPLIEFAPAGTEGFISPRALPWFDETEITGVKTLIDTETKYHGKVENRPEVMAGWVYGAVTCEAVKRAGEEVGYDNINGPAVKSALESMKDFDVDGIAKFTFGPDERRGDPYCAVYRIQGRKIVRLTDYNEVHILVP